MRISSPLPVLCRRSWDKSQCEIDLARGTVSTLLGERGFQKKEIAKLVHWIAGEPAFDVVVRGYRMDEVDAQIAGMQARIDELEADGRSGEASAQQ